MQKNRNFLMVLTALSTFVTVIDAKLYTPEFERSFYRQLGRHKMAIVHFNPFEEGDDDPDLERMQDAFKTLSKSTRYKDADLAFIGVNLQKLPALAEDFDVELPPLDQFEAEENAAADEQEGASMKEEVDIDPTDFPADQQATLILFKDGRPYKVGGKVAKLTGFVTRIEIEDFIEDNFSSLISSSIAEKRQQEAAREKVRRARPKPRRVVKRVYYRRPYPRYRYGYWRPYWRRRYWGGWGPGFGLGFGFGRRGFRGGYFGFGW